MKKAKDNNERNRAKDVKRGVDLFQNIKVTLLDIDSAILTHFRNTIQPHVIENEERIAVPIMFSDSERWKAMKKDGVIRDVKGQIQNPIIVMKRNSISRNDAMATLNRYVNYTYKMKYTPKNKYDKFSLMTGARPTNEIYSVLLPDYVNITYQCSVQTSFMESMNKLIEQIQFSADEYWGADSGYKFQVIIDDFSIESEVQDGEQRIIRAEFSMLVKAYLLPDSYESKFTTQKVFTPKRIVVTNEVEVTLDPATNLLTRRNTGRRSGTPGNTIVRNDENISLNVFLDAVEYLSETTTLYGVFVTSDNGSGESEFDFVGYKLNPIPANIVPYVTNVDRYQLYINGVLIDKNDYTVIDAPDNNGTDIKVQFNNTAVGYSLTATDEVVLVGKVVTS